MSAQLAPSPLCPRDKQSQCNHRDADYCCGGGADAPCDCLSCHPQPAIARAPLCIHCKWHALPINGLPAHEHSRCLLMGPEPSPVTGEPIRKQEYIYCLGCRQSTSTTVIVCGPTGKYWEARS